jgi:hypothetical protein
MSRTVTSVPAAPVLPVTPRQRTVGAALATPWDAVSLTPLPVLRVKFHPIATPTGSGARVAVPHDLLRTPFDDRVIELPVAAPADFSALVGTGGAAVPAPRRVSGSH